jgi:hypothetical protein
MGERTIYSVLKPFSQLQRALRVLYFAVYPLFCGSNPYHGPNTTITISFPPPLTRNDTNLKLFTPECTVSLTREAMNHKQTKRCYSSARLLNWCHMSSAHFCTTERLGFSFLLPYHPHHQLISTCHYIHLRAAVCSILPRETYRIRFYSLLPLLYYKTHLLFMPFHFLKH